MTNQEELVGQAPPYNFGPPRARDIGEIRGCGLRLRARDEAASASSLPELVEQSAFGGQVWLRRTKPDPAAGNASEAVSLSEAAAVLIFGAGAIRMICYSKRLKGQPQVR